MRTALIQFTSSDDPADNLDRIRTAIARAASDGAGFVLTPEVTNCLSTSTTHQRTVLRPEAEDAMLGALREQARNLGLWLLIGSLALRTEDADGRFANRSVLIGPDGDIAARYDKIHMFDVQVSETETYRESANFRPGSQAVLADTPFGRIGMTVCYDLRFPYLYSALAQAGATILTVPAAFSPVTGAAHWQPLLRARAIETGCYVLAPAQTGTHPCSRGRQRSTYGHSLAVSPWGEVLIDGGEGPGIHFLDLDAKAVAEARRRVPSLTHSRPLDGP
ncbi:Predicted amidohydrolase [Cribrihabitans marinus]|uniref:Predicted amidohydrolase n=1 Tax=Cribrihabitans marinus TaxID=1227549 RepID=A0A1H6YIK7_9RHOB|nr:carbon-nitrogen hydrolase family protein [Cribrihabitans marinus]GGH28705.1 amidohydrolase [Cribrihabitans marinus]SEJ37042.1 Predicted amidohydrolase [Cribrihabitans marinus]